MSVKDTKQQPGTETDANKPSAETLADDNVSGLNLGDTTEDLPSAKGQSAEAEEDSLEVQLAKAQEVIKDYWDQIMRGKAEMENNRKRAQRDVENAHKYAVKSFAESLLPIIDSMEMGQNAAAAENASVDSLKEGVAMTMSLLISAVEKHGLVQIDPKGEKFDPERHQAISMIEDKDHESNIIIEVMQKGFLLNDRLVRPAMVVVAK